MSGTKRACRMMLGLTLASLVASAAWAQDKPAQALTPSRQVAVAESGLLAPGAFGAGRAPQKTRPFEGLCHTYVQFRLPDLPKGQAVVRGVLRLHADYVSSHPPSVWAVVTNGALPENLTW
ncbi:MAG: hypothetical protein FJ279_37480, partial [Planctomycetes bacterium]|nr:hypothetical protein [Planctomycetota bacterium]